jgi:hypothetical protein
MILAEKYQPVVNDKSYHKLTKGSIEYRDWWNIQLDRCKNGYKPTNGSWIPGAYYFYINFCQIQRLDEKTNRKVIGCPAYRDQDHEYFLEVEKAVKGGYGLIIGKARRKGFSFNNMGIALHEYSFFSGTQIGVGSEVDTYVQDFRDRLVESYYSLPKELRLNHLHNNSDMLMSGYKVKDKDTGQWIEEGAKSIIHWRVMDPTGKKSPFRGLSLSKAFFEEFGEFRSGKKHYFSSEECWREGSKQFGVPIIGGTSNQISNESEDYFEMFNNPERFNLKALFIPATKVYYGFFDFKTGISDTVGAEVDIERRAAEKLKESKLAYYAFRQEMPTKPEHMWLKSSMTPFDLDKINAQIAELSTNKTLNIAKRAKIEWPRTPDGKKIFGGKPELIYDTDGPFVVVEPPLQGFVNSHVAAVDPYHIADQFEEKENKKRDSKGCMYVYRRFINVDIPGDMPVLEYYDRPDTKEEFYENCLKICILYDTKVLVEYNDSGFLEYFERHKMMRYLKERPKSADAPYSQVTNRYGIHMKEYQKRLAIDLIADYIKKNCDDIYFINLLKEFVDFGKKNVDRVMAFGMCLLHNQDNVTLVKPEDEKKEKAVMPHFIKDASGRIIPVGANKKNNNFGINIKLPK